jgi:hypothetical protein
MSNEEFDYLSVVELIQKADKAIQKTERDGTYSYISLINHNTNSIACSLLALAEMVDVALLREEADRKLHLAKDSPNARCYNGGKRHNFEPRFSEVQADHVKIGDIQFFNFEQLRSLCFYQKYLGDVCTWCGKTTHPREDK